MVKITVTFILVFLPLAIIAYFLLKFLFGLLGMKFNLKLNSADIKDVFFGESPPISIDTQNQAKTKTGKFLLNIFGGYTMNLVVYVVLIILVFIALIITNQITPFFVNF